MHFDQKKGWVGKGTYQGMAIFKREMISWSFMDKDHFRHHWKFFMVKTEKFHGKQKDITDADIKLFIKRKLAKKRVASIQNTLNECKYLRFKIAYFLNQKLNGEKHETKQN